MGYVTSVELFMDLEFMKCEPSILFFKGYLETEVNFYDKLIPELRTLGTPLPHLFPYLWGDYETHSKEVLLLERREDFNLAPLSSEGK